MAVYRISVVLIKNRECGEQPFRRPLACLIVGATEKNAVDRFRIMFSESESSAKGWEIESNITITQIYREKLLALADEARPLPIEEPQKTKLQLVVDNPSRKR